MLGTLGRTKGIGEVNRLSGLEFRLEEWGAWRVGAASVKIAPWARQRVQITPMSSCDDAALNELERALRAREIDEIIRYMHTERQTADLAVFARVAYPYSTRLEARLGMSRQTIAERKKTLHRVVARLIDQRRRGEPPDVSRRREHPRGARVVAQVGDARRTIASVAVD